MTESAGILVYRSKDDQIEVLIVHPGGPYFTKKDEGVWSMPKGLVEDGEDRLEAAKREFEEEVGLPAPEGDFKDLGEVIYPRKDKKILAWAIEGDLDLTNFKSNTFELEWPPRSGRKEQFPEMDRAEWHTLDSAARKIFPPNIPFLQRLAEMLDVDFDPSTSQQKQLGLL